MAFDWKFSLLVVALAFAIQVIYFDLDINPLARNRRAPTNPTTTAYTTGEICTTTVQVETITTTVQTPTLLPDDPKSLCYDLGILNLYNAIFNDFYVGSTSDVEGRLAVGGYASFQNGFSVGDKLPNTGSCNVPTTVIGGSLVQWLSGLNYYGDLVVGTYSNIHPSVLYPSCGVVQNPNFLDFQAIDSQVKTISQNLASRTSTATYTVAPGGDIQITLGGFDIEIINVPNANFFLNEVKHFLVPTNYKPDSVIVFNIPGNPSGLVSHNQEGLKDMNVIFNFYQASSLTIKEIAVRGWVLAPHADINGPTGVIHGSVYAKSLTGSIQINLNPFDLRLCVPQNEQPPCVQFGSWFDFNAVFHEDFVGSTSDVQGKLAAGGDIDVRAGFSVGDQLVHLEGAACLPGPEPLVTIAGGSIKWPSGRNYYGNAAVGNLAETAVGMIFENVKSCDLKYLPNYFPFNALRQSMIALSEGFCSLSDTGAEMNIDSGGALDLKLTNSFLEVINVDNAALFQGTVNFVNSVTNAKPNGIIVFNFDGENGAIVGGNMEAFKNYNVLFNFCKAKTLLIKEVALQAHVLAPYADVTAPTGVIEGRMYGKSFNGSLQFNVKPFPSCPPTVKTRVDGGIFAALEGSGGTGGGVSAAITSFENAAYFWLFVVLNFVFVAFF
ncbi:hypothetical protein MP638_000172 [Amoeboaphelidium occidentale]|nr:hypothetical protein MP638_000172 [Amoeboaphelidium occidentale]